MILDWVPSHFATDQHGLGLLRRDPSCTSTPILAGAITRTGASYIFNYDRAEVQSFLLSSAHFWLDRYHADGLRVDGVASMLYLDYSRKHGQWIPNEKGGRENLGAVEFFRQMNASVHRSFPGRGDDRRRVDVLAPRDRHSGEAGGLGFHYKWDMGWMNDTMRYCHLDPLFRSHPDSHRLVTFRGHVRQHRERSSLALSHDEVVHGKRSLLGEAMGRQPPSQFAGLRTLLRVTCGRRPARSCSSWAASSANGREWNHDAALDWVLLDYPAHRAVARLGQRPSTASAAANRRLYQDDHQPERIPVGRGQTTTPRAVFAYLRLAPEATAGPGRCSTSPRCRWDRLPGGCPCQRRMGSAGSRATTPSTAATGLGVAGAVDHRPGPPTGLRPIRCCLTLPPLSAVFMVLDRQRGFVMAPSRPDVLSMVLAGGEGKRLMPLTRDRAKPAVPFGGHYRLIDFALSNLVNGGQRHIVVLTQYKSHSLNVHLSRTWRMSTLLGNYVTSVPAQMRLGQRWFLGSADAIYQNLNLVEDANPDYLFVFGADHIYRMDPAQMLQPAHRVRGRSHCGRDPGSRSIRPISSA